MDAAQQRPGEGEGDLVVAEVGLGVSPHGGLLGGRRGGGRGGDGRIAQRVLLVAGGLQLSHRQLGVVHAQAARRAVLQDEAGVPVEEGAEPVEVGAVMAEQAGTGAFGAVLGAGADVDVVVELQIAHAPLAHDPVDDLVEVGTGGGVAQVQVVAAVFGDPDSVPAEEGLGRQGVGQGAAYADDFGLQPQSRGHSVPSDRVQNLLDAAREAAVGGVPGADGVPPALGVVVVPAGVDDEDLGPDGSGRFDERQELVGGGVAHQGVHVVVVDHRERPVVGVAAADPASVCGEFAERGVQAAGLGMDEDGGYGAELLARCQRPAPLVMRVIGAEQGEVGRAFPFTGLEAPPRAGLDLPEPGTAAAVGERGDRQVPSGRPTALRVPLEAAAALMAVGGPAQRDDLVTERGAAPAAFGEPVVVRPVQGQAVQPVRLVEDAAEREG